MNFTKKNTLTGWFVFFIAFTTYYLTVEPTASYWDCSEYIATSAKLQVGHPPGAPLFQMMGAFFSSFASGSENVGFLGKYYVGNGKCLYHTFYVLVAHTHHYALCY